MRGRCWQCLGRGVPARASGAGREEQRRSQEDQQEEQLQGPTELLPGSIRGGLGEELKGWKGEIS